MKRTILISITLLAVAGICAAQGPRGSRTGAGGACSVLDMSKLQTVTGTVAAVNIGYGLQYPSITVNQVQIKLAPVWYLLDMGAEVKVGDSVSVVGAPSTVASDSYLYAIEMTNTVSGLRIVLRDSAGVPLWTARGNTAGLPATGTCLGTSTLGTVSGTVDTISMGVGIQMPTLTLKATDGTLLVFKLGPERILLGADLELKPGDALTVKYAQSACTGELLALTITTSSGQTLILRDDDGKPAWR